MAQRASDNFNRANELPIGAPWAGVAGMGTCKIASNVFCANASGDSMALHTVVLPSDQYAEVTVANFADDGGPVIRCSATEFSGYLLDLTTVENVGQLIVVTNDFTTFNLLGSSFSVVGLVSTDVFRIGAVGNLISVWMNGTLKASGTDGTWTSGSSGIFCFNSVITFDNFACGDFLSSNDPYRFQPVSPQQRMA